MRTGQTKDEDNVKETNLKNLVTQSLQDITEKLQSLKCRPRKTDLKLLFRRILVLPKLFIQKTALLFNSVSF